MSPANNLPQDPQSISDELIKLGAKIIRKKGLGTDDAWVIEYSLQGLVSILICYENRLTIERHVPIMQSGHQPDSYKIKSHKINSNKHIVTEAIEFIKSCQCITK